MNSAASFSRSIVAGVCAAAFALAAAGSAQAQNNLPATQQAPGGASYVNGGVSDSEQQHMKGIAGEWPLRITSALATGGNYVADAHLVVKGAQDGKTWLDLDRAGPMTFVKLPAGEYKVMADYQGQSESRNVSIGAKGGQAVEFRWKAADKQ